MREILFRGKRKDSGEWVYGFLCKTYSPSNPKTRDAIMHKNEPSCWAEYSCAEIDVATVGQFTGLTDKKGKKIFEGDIVRTLAPCSIDNYVKGVVMFGEYPTTYQSSNCGYYVKWQLILNKNLAMYCAKNDIEIIGNIHDNPELLKGEKE